LLARTRKIHPHAVTTADEVRIDARRRSFVRVVRVQFVQIALTGPRVEHEHLSGRRSAGTRQPQKDDGAQFLDGGLRSSEAWRWNETFS
jgi:hypothetical protein